MSSETQTNKSIFHSTRGFLQLHNVLEFSANCWVFISPAHASIVYNSTWNIVMSFPRLTDVSAFGSDLKRRAAVLEPQVNQQTASYGLGSVSATVPL